MDCPHRRGEPLGRLTSQLSHWLNSQRKVRSALDYIITFDGHNNFIGAGGKENCIRHLRALVKDGYRPDAADVRELCSRLRGLLRSDGPLVGGSPLVVGGEQWGEVVDGPVGEASWTSARWRRVVTGQFASALERGELWIEDGSRMAGTVPIAAMGDVCNVGPQDRRIRGSIGVFDAYHGWNGDAQFPAIWSLDSSVHQSMSSEPNAWLAPKPGHDHQPVWSQAGTLQITRDVRYNAQRVMAVRTDVRTLGVRAWHTLSVQEDNPVIRSRLEIALALWCNSTLGMLLHADHSNSAQEGRGQGNKGMLESLTTLDIQQLKAWQIDEALAMWQDFKDRKFQPFYQCAVDPVRIQLDECIVRDLLGLGEDAVASVARLRQLLASDPSIHGSKSPELATQDSRVQRYLS